MASAALPRRDVPRRDVEARARLTEVAGRARPVTPAGERTIPLRGGLGTLVPGASLTRGTVVRVAGVRGGGAGVVAFELAAAVTALGEWAAAVDLDGSLGALAAAEAGVELERFAVVRRVPPARWASVVAALIEGTSLVLAEVPRGLGIVDARRLVARARERGTVLVAHETGTARWPGDAALTLCAEACTWEWAEGGGHLRGGRVHVRVDGRGAAARPRTGELARAV